MHRGTRAVGCAAALLAALLVPVTIGALDLDSDGLSDELEQSLADRFAPLLVFHPEEENFPSTVPWYLDRAELFFIGKCRERLLVRQPSVSELVAQREEEGVRYDDPSSGYAECLSDRIGGRSFSSGYSVDPATGRPRRTPYYLRIPGDDASTRRGDLAGSRIYVHVRRSPPHHPDLIDVTYWIFYPYNPDVCHETGEHDGDWEHVTVRVELDPAGVARVHALAFAAHGDPEWRRAADVQMTASGQPIVYVAKGSHASYATAGKQERDWVCDDHTAWVADDGDGVPESGESRVFDTRGRVLGMGEWQAPAQEFLAYSGFWGLNDSDFTFLAEAVWSELSGVHSPETPTYKESWPADDPSPSAQDHPETHPWLFVDGRAAEGGDGRWGRPLRGFSADHLTAYHALRCAPLVPGGPCAMKVLLEPGRYRGRNASDTGPGQYLKPMVFSAPRGGATIGE